MLMYKDADVLMPEIYDSHICFLGEESILVFLLSIYEMHIYIGLVD